MSRIVFVLLFFAWTLALAVDDRPRIALDKLAWLAGEWTLSDGDRSVEEIWTTPATDMMIGMSRTVRDGKTLSFEFMRIVARDDGVFYIAQPRGRPAVEFPLQRGDRGQVVFVNAGADDHLNRIVYRDNGDGTMTARVEGADGGKDFADDYRYRRRHAK